MRQILKTWYEQTVIPAIVLACMTGLGQFAIRWLLECNPLPYVSLWEVLFAFTMFLTLMTLEDLWGYFKEMFEALSSFGDSFPF